MYPHVKTPKPIEAHPADRLSEGGATTAVETPTPAPEHFLTERELAQRWHLNPGSLANLRSAGRSPIAYRKVVGRVLYALDDVLAHEDASRVAA